MNASLPPPLLTQSLAQGPTLRDATPVSPMLPPREQMLRAFLERDPTAEGVFYAGVTSTRIYCRPTCRARKARPENIEFFQTAADAEGQGYRACRLCHPNLPMVSPPPLVQQLSRLLSDGSRDRLSDKALSELNIDPSTARRQFQRYFGMTFQQYQRRTRLGNARQALAAGETVVDAQARHGFASPTGFRAAFAKRFDATPGHARKAKACLWTRQYATPLGAMLGVADDRGLHVFDFTDRRGLPRRIELLERQTRCVLTPGDHPILKELGEQLQAYWEGSHLSFALPLAATGSAWERGVWSYLQSIPPGHTKTYGEVAAALGRPSARRAVGRANGSNYLEIVVPCHRVIRSDGSPCGYGGGLWRKEWLLGHERKHAKGRP